MTTVNQMKCACGCCLCIVPLETAVKKDGKNYCCDACANGHPDGAGCCHTGCECGK